MEVIDFLKKYENILSLNKIEQELGIPQSTLYKAVKGVRLLPKKSEHLLKNYFKHIGHEISLLDEN